MTTDADLHDARPCRPRMDWRHSQATWWRSPEECLSTWPRPAEERGFSFGGSRRRLTCMADGTLPIEEDRRRLAAVRWERKALSRLHVPPCGSHGRRTTSRRSSVEAASWRRPISGRDTPASSAERRTGAARLRPGASGGRQAEEGARTHAADVRPVARPRSARPSAGIPRDGTGPLQPSSPAARSDFSFR